MHASYENGMLGQRGESCQNAQKQFTLNVHKSLILYKPIALYQLTMVYIQFVVMTPLSEQVTLIDLETEKV